MSWDTCKFSSLYATPSRNGLTRPSGSRGKGYKMVNMGELFSNGRIGNIPMELVELEDSKKEAYGVKEGDLLFARQSLVLEGAGKCSWIKEVSEYTTFESHLIRVRLNPDVAVSLFYYYYFNSPQSPIKSIVQQCAQAGIRASDLEDLNVLCPPLPIQRRIADILSVYDDLIENNQRQIKLLEEAAMRLYREWFVFMRFPGHESVRIVDGVPEGWVTAPASELFDITIGRTPSRSEPKWFSTNSDGVKWVSIRDIGDANVFIYNTNECLTQGAVEEFNLNLIPANTVLLSFKLTVGAVAITTENMFTNEAIAHFRTDDERMIEYIYEYLKSFSYESLGNTSSISTAINSKIVKGMVFVLPSKSVLEEFHNLTSPLFQEIRKKSESILHLQKARDALLPRLLNGGVGLKLEEGTV